ncbi:MAG TPA: hypothetical protein VKA70_13115 [Blastocatellia bacterium]|nr:hypothetical protein [Blastocatellia bacterium]
MPTGKVQMLLDAYFNRPVEDYVAVLSSVQSRGGLNQGEIEAIKDNAFYIHSNTIIRHVEIVSG